PRLRRGSTPDRVRAGSLPTRDVARADQRTRFPSPLVGEGGPSRRRGPGEGFCCRAFARYPSPGSSLARARNEPPSPARGEGKCVCRSVSQQSSTGRGKNSPSPHKDCAVCKEVGKCGPRAIRSSSRRGGATHQREETRLLGRLAEASHELR